MIELTESKIYEFGEFRLDEKSHCLFRRETGELVPLTQKAVEVLLYLAQNAGRVLLKDELIEKVWGNSFVEDANLSQTIFVLRKTLGETAKKPRFILTIPNRGYQFIAEVRQFHAEDKILEETFLSDYSQVQSSNQKSKIKNQKLVWLAVPLVLLMAFGVYWFYPREKPANGKEIKTIAVLPFEDLSAEQTEKYLGVSLAEALVNKFGNLREITVRPMRSVMKYADSREDLGKIGRELQVDAVLDGRIQRVGEQVRVSVQLIRTSDNTTIWAETFDDQFTNFFAVQDSISRKIVQKLALQMNAKERERFDQRGTENAEAYQDYLRGIYFRNKRINNNLPKAVANFENAVQKDPNFALAYAELANSYLLMPEYVGTPTSESLPKAKEYATKALELDDHLAEAHTTLAGVISMENGDFAELEKRLKRALELNPNYVLARRWYGVVLRKQKRYDEALTELKRASELDPTSTVIMNNIAQTYKEQGNYDAAIEQLNKALNFDPNAALTLDELARVLYKKGLYAEALVESQKAVDLSDRLHTLLVTLGEIYIKLGERNKALDVIKELETKYPSAASYYIAMLYAEFGDREKMYEWLERAIKEKPRDLFELKVEPNFAPYRNEPRFQDLLRRMGF